MISIHFVCIQFRCWKLSTGPGDVELTLKTSNLGGLETGACSFMQLILVVSSRTSAAWLWEYRGE